MKKLLIISMMLILIISLLFLIIKPILTGKTIDNENLSVYTYTKAICNKTNYCIDNEIKCRGKEVISVTPITGAAVQFSEDWEDSRGQETIETLC